MYELGQKLRVDPDSPSVLAHTTLYLDADEHARLSQLPAATLTKTRVLRLWGDLTLAVDVFAGQLQGLVLAEVDLGEAAELLAAGAPRSCREVTDDERFAGGALAGTTSAQLAALLREPAVGG